MDLMALILSIELSLGGCVLSPRLTTPKENTPETPAVQTWAPAEGQEVDDSSQEDPAEKEQDSIDRPVMLLVFSGGNAAGNCPVRQSHPILSSRSGRHVRGFRHGREPPVQQAQKKSI